MKPRPVTKHMHPASINALFHAGLTTRISSAVLLLFFILSVIPVDLRAQSYGLQFASRDADPEKRTSLDLTPDKDLCVSKKLELSFELTFNPNSGSYFGYVFRIMNDKKQNLDMLYDHMKKSFKIIFGDSYTNISVNTDPDDLVNYWKKFRLVLDFAGTVSLYSDGKLVQSTKLSFKSNCIRICFGASNYVYFKSSDVTPMKLRNILLTVNDTEQYFWPLNESSGHVIRDSIAQKKALVLNEHWLRPRHSNWELSKSFPVKGFASAGFDPLQEQLYITGPDSLYIFSAKTSLFTAIPLSARHDLMRGNQTIFNPFNNRLYDFYTDQHDVVIYDSSLRRWNRHFLSAPLTEYFQVNRFFSRHDSALYVMGGYGQLRYKNQVQRYHPDDESWEMVKAGGDYFMPRYLAALGTTPNGDSAYILGGYGSKDGDQLLNPQFFYDLLLYDVRTARFKKIYSLREPAEPFVFGTSMVIDADRKHYYALINPKDQLNTQLQLIHGSLEKPEYELIGSPFPYTFHDVRSSADLYYCSTSKLFLAVTLYANKEDNTEVRIYSINYPPNKVVAAEMGSTGGSPLAYYVMAALALIVIAFAVMAYKSGWFKKKALLQPAPAKNTSAGASPVLTPPAAPPSAPIIANEHDGMAKEPEIVPDARIYLFGNFEVISSKGENITRLFTPLLKELFLLLCTHSIRYNKGVSPEKLTEILWTNKETKDAINNRSVNIAKLKSILEKIDECSLQKEFGYWKLEFNREKLYIDFDNYMHIFSESTLDNRSLNELIYITQRGAFLPQADYQWADNFKSEISNFIVDALLKYCQLLTLPENAEKIIAVCNSIFFFDELNENALRLKCRSLIALGRHTLAKQAFEKFIIKYKDIYGGEYNVTYNTLIQ